MNNAGYEQPIKLFGQNVYGATNASYSTFIVKLLFITNAQNSNFIGNRADLQWCSKLKFLGQNAGSGATSAQIQISFG
jgi:hypothetical protein